MLLKHIGIIHFVDVVAAENKDILRLPHIYKVYVLINGVCRSGEPLTLCPGALVGGQNINASALQIQIPWLTRADIAVELEGLILCENADYINAGIGTIGEGKVDNAVFSAEGHNRFRGLVRKSVKS